MFTPNDVTKMIRWLLNPTFVFSSLYVPCNWDIRVMTPMWVVPGLSCTWLFLSVGSPPNIQVPGIPEVLTPLHEWWPILPILRTVYG